MLITRHEQATQIQQSRAALNHPLTTRSQTYFVSAKKMGSGLKPIYFCYVLDFTGEIGVKQSLFGQSF